MRPMETTPTVRFDDLRSESHASFALTGSRGSIEAHGLDTVVPALEEVEAAVSRGLWAGGFVAYEAAPAFDPGFVVHHAVDGLPLVWFGLFEGAEVPALPDPSCGYRLSEWTPSIGRDRFDADIERIQALIAAGETYQVNHTFTLRSSLEGDPACLYRDLCLAQRPGYAAFVGTGRHTVLSASPELFFELDGGLVTCRPMKGTARRGRWPAEDAGARDGLAGSVKDRAENAMIVDLIRSDLGRIAIPGTVEVPSMFDVERYETVWQMTSTVRARVPERTRTSDLFGALFPCGSVTGAPKVRTMRAIAELEDEPRGVYTGAIGWLAPPGTEGPTARFSVAIRTVVVDDATGVAGFGVGGGITWDSSPGGEFEEARMKAAVLTTRRPAFELIESMRFDPGCGPGGGFLLLERHLERLAGSAAYFGFAYDEERVLRELAAAVAGRPGEALRVRMLLGRDGAPRAEAEPVPSAPAEPVRVSVHDAERVDPTDVFLFHKTTLRERYARAWAAHPGADDVLLVNLRGEVTEATIANLAFRADGRWWTPPIRCGLLPGARRAELLADGALAERVLTREGLGEAEALALVSSVRGWRSARLV